VPTRHLTLRLAALMGAGTVAVHELRFLLHYGSDASAAVQGHGYLVPLTPVVVGALLLALAGVVARVARGTPDRAPRFRRVWAGASASLLAVYCAQESLEGVLAARRLDGLAAVLGDGGWIALPLAVALGLAIALVVRGAAAAPEVLGGGRRSLAAPRVPPPALAFHPPARWAPALAPAARHLAPRGPPAAARS
jgi:hypothetical protein